MNTKKLKLQYTLPVLALCIALGSSMATSYAESPSALDMTADGAESMIEGTVNVIATPIVVTKDLSEGKLDSAITSAVGLPISGVTSATTGLVKVISGVGKGAAQITSHTFNGIGEIAGSTQSAINDNLPSVDVDVNVTAPANSKTSKNDGSI